MPAGTPTKSERQAPKRARAIIEPESDDTLRGLAIERIHRVRRFKLHLVAFALGIPLLGTLWLLTEYYEEHTWPSRFASDPEVAGTWDPWLFFVAGIWLTLLVIHALRTYLGPPIGPIGRYIRRPLIAGLVAPAFLAASRHLVTSDRSRSPKPGWQRR